MWKFILFPILPFLWFIDHARQGLGYNETNGLTVVFLGAPIGILAWIFILYEIVKHVRIT